MRFNISEHFMSGMAGPTPKVGQRVEALGKDCTGKIAYIGSTQFAQGKWIGECKGWICDVLICPD